MNKSILKNFAVNARNELIERVKQKAYEIGITEDKVKQAQLEASDTIYINGKPLSNGQVKRRNSLIKQIDSKGYSQVMEEVAYTWFNRLCALRFMEVNGFLPTRVRVLSSELPGSVEPDILREALNVDLDIEREAVLEFKEKNDSNGLFKYMLIKQCNNLNQCFPFLFEKIEDYTEILFPDNLLKEGSFLQTMVDTEHIPERDWQDVEIIGWLYQYYISEKKDQVFADLKKNVKISKENIPAATQLFTPHWIVRYLLENSLGRLWLLNRPESKLIEKMDYYIKPEQEETPGDIAGTGVSPFLKVNSPEEIKICDPACGSGHMLVYAFDLLYAIYEEEGYPLTEIPGLILEKNLYGIEIDKRAGELAAFALVMKARQKYRRFLRQPIQPNILVLENIKFDRDELKNYQEEIGVDLFTASLFPTLRQFEEADNFGSLIKPELTDVSDVLQQLEAKNVENNLFLSKTHQKVLQALKQVDYLSQKYHVVIANPPYMGGKGMNTKLKAFAGDNYPNSKSDLFAIFIERGFHLILERGYNAMVTMQSWMFLSSYEKLRAGILNNKTIVSMAHLGARAFDSIGGEVVSTTAFVIENAHNAEYKGAYLRLVDGSCEADKEAELKANRLKPYRASASDFKKIPGSPIAYWVSEKIKSIFGNREVIGDIAPVRKGIDTGKNELFLRYWYEVEHKGLSGLLYKNKWHFYIKGGEVRKWYGNIDLVVNWGNNGREIRNHPSSTIRNESFFFKSAVTWSLTGTKGFGARYVPENCLFDNNGSSVFPYNKDIQIIILQFLNTIVATHMLKVLNPTIAFQVGDISNLPVSKNKHEIINTSIGNRLLNISIMDWDSYETSWDFTVLPLLKPEYYLPSIQGTYNNLRSHWREMTQEMQQLEEKNNLIFIEAYGLQDELTPEVPLSEITLTCNPYYRYGGNWSEEELERLLLLDTIKEYISYAVGCMLGRYSLDKEGLAFAGGEFDPAQYKTYPADRDNVIPVLAEDYFKDDIVTRFVDFVRLTFGPEKLEENLDFIADTLGRKASESARDSIRRYFVNDFYKDHLKTYKKRPIYWMFSSGKEKAFNCLIYLHRYQPDTIATIRTEYLHRLQEALEVEKQHLQRVIDEEAGTRAARNAVKSMVKLDKQIAELKKYEELIHHYADMGIAIDLDDGVKVNYAKFDGLLAKI
jgi:type II restriction/modification system DNA methylase subunit YeeA